MNTANRNRRNRPARHHSRHALVVAALAATGALLLTPVTSAQSSQDRSGQAVQQAEKERIRNIAKWDLPKRTKLAIGGYDPVAYFPEGGGKAKKGSKSIEHTYKGVTYRFSSREHLELFKKAPDRYEPAHGGWCSWAMASGGTTEANPKSFIVKDDRLFLFYDGLFGNTRKDWLKGNHNELADQADREWKELSREDKRQVKRPAA